MASECYIVQFKVSGLLHYNQAYIVTREQLDIVKDCKIKLDSLCGCDGCELCMAGSVDIEYLDCLYIGNKVSPALTMLESTAIRLGKIIDACSGDE